MTEQDRIFLRIMLEKRYPKAKIAQILKVDPSTIYREVKRNSCTHWYSGQKYYWNCTAQKKYLKRRKRGLKLENENRCIISHESIYHYIYSDRDRRYLLHKHLRRKHHYRIKQGQRKPRIPHELLIGSRPESINNREEFGHWECDLMVFKKGKRENLITLRERKSLVAIKNQSREAAGTALTLISNIKNIKHLVKSITFDQGSEFKKYPWIKECLNADIYFF